MTGQKIDPMHWGTDRSKWSMHLLFPHLSIANHSLKQSHTLWKCTILYKMQEPACLITQVTGETWPWFICPWIQGLYSVYKVLFKVCVSWYSQFSMRLAYDLWEGTFPSMIVTSQVPDSYSPEQFNCCLAEGSSWVQETELPQTLNQGL